MVSIEDIRNDKRFNVNPTTLRALFDRLEIKRYRLTTVSVGKIRRCLYGKIFPLYKTEAYQLLEHPNSVSANLRYKEYCDIKDAREDNPIRSKEYFMNFASEFSASDYDILKGVIIIDQFFCIEEGLHRCCIILKEKGPDYFIPVLQIYKPFDSCLEKIRSYLGMFRYNLKLYLHMI